MSLHLLVIIITDLTILYFWGINSLMYCVLIHVISMGSHPAAATTVIPAFVKRKIAAFSAVDAGPPILKFKTA